MIQQYSLVNSDKCLNICFNYGGRSEIIRAINSFVDKSCVSEAELRSALYTKNLPDPDVLIRTGGEHRISNFLLFQIAYSEIYFIDTLWPDFSTDELQNILNDYAITDRRFGKI